MLLFFLLLRDRPGRGQGGSSRVACGLIESRADGGQERTVYNIAMI